MELSKDQKTLKTLATVVFIAGIICLVLGAFSLYVSYTASANGELVVSQTSVGKDDLKTFISAFMISGISNLVMGAVCLMDWGALKRFLKDSLKFSSARTLTLIAACISAAALIIEIFTTKDTKSLVCCCVVLGLNAYILFLITKIREAYLADTSSKQA